MDDNFRIQWTTIPHLLDETSRRAHLFFIIPPPAAGNKRYSWLYSLRILHSVTISLDYLIALFA